MPINHEVARSRPWQQAACVIATLAVMISMLALDGVLGPFSFTLRRAFALGVLLAIYSGSIGVGGLRGGWTWALAVGSLALVAQSPSVPVALLGLTLAVSLLPTDSVSSRTVRLPAGLSQTCLTYAAFRFVADLVPRVAETAGRIPDSLGASVKVLRGFDLQLGFTTIGGPAVAISSIFLLWRWRLVGGRRRAIGSVAIPLAWFATLGFLIPGAQTGPLEVLGRCLSLGLFWLGMAVLLDGYPEAERLPRTGGSNPDWRLPMMASCVASAVGGVCLVGTSLIGPSNVRSIVVHNRGGLDWDRPVFGNFGGFSGGMFGLLPVYCRAEGYRFGVIDRDEVTADDLVDAQILMLINSPKLWEGREKQLILDFVARGGSLLILGDHTDVFGLMRGFNGLLDTFGIQFRFDSAYKARETWRGCQTAAADAIAWSWDEENPSVAVGASLALSGFARPLLTGRYGFSDAGVRENYVGSFLGNYTYDRGERLGDIPLVATATHGRGRVVVWGDTSAFQGGLSRTYAPVVGPLLEWLSRPTSWTERSEGRIGSALGLLAVISWTWTIRASSLRAGIIASSLLMGLAIPWLLSRPILEARPRIAEDAILIDQSHFPAAGHYEARINPLGPLYTNLYRSGFRVFDMPDWDRRSISSARSIAFVAPQMPFAQGEIEELLKAEDAGLVVLLAAGQPDAWASKRLLAAHGLTLGVTPLGTITPADPEASRKVREEQPRFLDAWPIVSLEGGDASKLPGVEVIFQQRNDVVALFKRRGRGGLLLISDTRFFSDMNVEDISDYWPGNLALIHDIFRKYLGGTPDSVAPLFRSPRKPQ